MIPKKLPPLPPIRDLIRVYGLSADQKFSQNFILDKNVTDAIAQRAKISVYDDLVVEVGPGPGLLTRSILDAGARRVVAVEKDSRFTATLQQLSEASDNRLQYILGDMLTMDHARIFQKAATIPHVTSSEPQSSTSSESIQLPSDQVTGHQENFNWAPLVDTNATIRLLGNLPFGIASPLLIQWLKMMALRQGIFQGNNNVSMTLMFQKEVAERIVAGPNNPHRGRLSVMAQSICDVKMAYRLSAGAFVPKPKVDAAVIHFERKKEPLVPGSLDSLEDVARYYFNKRRKTVGHITNRLAKAEPRTRPILDAWMTQGAWDMNGYLISQAELDQDLESFRASFAAHGKVDRNAMMFMVQKKDDPADQMLVFFPDESSVGIKTIKKYCELMVAKGVGRGIVVYQDKITPSAAKVISEVSHSYHLESFQEADLLVNITEHTLVPQHIVLTPEEKETLLKR
ncbi:Dimethyladenosine transferase 1, mitochondrial, partial [Podila epigama]